MYKSIWLLNLTCPLLQTPLDIDYNAACLHSALRCLNLFTFDFGHSTTKYLYFIPYSCIQVKQKPETKKLFHVITRRSKQSVDFFQSQSDISSCISLNWHTKWSHEEQSSSLWGSLACKSRDSGNSPTTSHIHQWAALSFTLTRITLCYKY